MTPNPTHGRRSLSRREFLVCSAALLALGPGAAHGATGRSRPVRVIFARDGADPELAHGLRFGAAEMQHTARLLRSSFELVEVAAAEAAARGRRDGAHVIVCASPVAAELAGSADVLVLDAAARATAPSCAGVLRLGLTAAEQGVLSDGDVVEIWHPSLYRFGAAQLNERYERAHGSGMTSGAWCGWMAVKAVWEAAQRTDGSAGAMRGFLTRAETRLDGHKGEALHFDVRTGWLVQPLYRVAAGEVTGDIASAAAAAAVTGEASCE